MRRAPWSGVAVVLGGAILTTLLIVALNRLTYLPNRGIVYLPVVAFTAYYWDWRHGAVAALLDLACIYLFLTPPFDTFKPLTNAISTTLLIDAASITFVMAVVQLAAGRRAIAEREAARFASLTSVGLALAGELNEERLLRLIAQTACDLTGAGFAAFTLRPLDTTGRPLAPSRGEFFHLAAVVGVTPEQEQLFRRMPLGGEGLLAPIFRFGKSVRVADALMTLYGPQGDGDKATMSRAERHDATYAVARAYAHGAAAATDLRSMGMPRGHPVVRSFLGAPLLDRVGDVRGGLLLGHVDPDRFTADDERLLMGLAAQAATALENARLYHSAQAQAQELDVIFETIADGVMLVDAQGQTLRENGAAKSLRSALDAESASALVGQANDGARHSTVTQVRLDGEQRMYTVSVNSVRAPLDDNSPAEAGQKNDGRAGAVIVWHDVTEAQQLIAERRAHADAEARLALLQLVVDELPSGVYLVYGPDARLALANRAAHDVWGGDWQVDQPMLEFLREHGTHVLRPDRQLLPLDELETLRAVRNGSRVRHHQEIIVRKDGSEVPVLFNAVVVHPDLLRDMALVDGATDPENEHAVVVVLQDMTPVKVAEQLKDEFIAMAAHELRTPMAAVKGYAEMLQRGVRGEQGAPLAEWQREALDSIDLATTRLVDLTNDLLDVSRLQAHRMELRHEPNDLLALTRRVARRFQVITQNHSIAIRSPDDYVVADIDAPRMEQIIGNLLSNAIKYSPAGGEIAVDVTADEDAYVARVSVRDSGIGIPQSQQDQLFSRFGRADNARELGIAGTGLGLYLCRELLVQQGGRIWLESQEGSGTTVFFEVPLHKAEPDPTSGAEPIER
ncbi:MAG TPA: ATP-binding protein [Ktedonobacterales bacterium]|nr:ATP-binding protein [Ktedonobacterales bacterium]